MRKIIAYKNYFSDFIKKLSADETNKIRRALDLFKVEDRMPRHFIKFIRDGVYEFRVNYGNNEFRIFFIYDGDTVVVLFNAFKKKTQKTPDNEIKKAIKLKEEYYEAKRNQRRGRNTMPRYYWRHAKTRILRKRNSQSASVRTKGIYQGWSVG